MSIFIVLIGCCVESVVIRHHKTTLNELNDHIRVYYEDPCDEVSEYQKAEKQYIKSYRECWNGPKIKKWATYYCREHYMGEWIPALDRLNNCAYGRRKRDVVTAIKTVTAATNMMKSFFTKGDDNGAKNRLKNYNITNHLNLTFMRDLYKSTTINNNSNNMAISNQTGIVDEATLELTPRHVIGDYMLHQSIAVKSYLLRKIAETCKSTRNLDVAAIAELIEDPELLVYTQNQTKITDVVVKKEENYFEIVFEAKITIDGEEEVDVEVVADTLKPFAIVLLLIVVTSLLLIWAGVYWFIRTRTQPEPTAWGEMA